MGIDKNVVWNDDGTNLTAILTPTLGVTQTRLKASDVNAAPMSGVSASIQ